MIIMVFQFFYKNFLIIGKEQLALQLLLLEIKLENLGLFYYMLLVDLLNYLVDDNQKNKGDLGFGMQELNFYDSKFYNDYDYYNNSYNQGRDYGLEKDLYLKIISL